MSASGSENAGRCLRSAACVLPDVGRILAETPGEHYRRDRRLRTGQAWGLLPLGLSSCRVPRCSSIVQQTSPDRGRTQVAAHHRSACPGTANVPRPHRERPAKPRRHARDATRTPSESAARCIWRCRAPASRCCCGWSLRRVPHRSPTSSTASCRPSAADDSSHGSSAAWSKLGEASATPQAWCRVSASACPGWGWTIPGIAASAPSQRGEPPRRSALHRLPDPGQFMPNTP